LFVCWGAEAQKGDTKMKPSQNLKQKRTDQLVKWFVSIMWTVLACIIGVGLIWTIFSLSSDITQVTVSYAWLQMMFTIYLIVGLFLGIILAETGLLFNKIEAIDRQIRDAVLTEKVEEILEKKKKEKQP